MVDTIKFSQMTNAGNINNNDIMPSLRSGENVILNNPWTFLPPGTTAERPTPSTTVNYRLRFNTDEQLYEYYDAVLGAWTQLQESAFTVGPFVTYTADTSLPGAQNLGALANGILKQTITAGVATLDIAVNGTDYYGPGFVIPGTDGGTGVNNGARTINLGSPTTGYVLTSDVSGNATWQAISVGGAITTIDGDSGSVTPLAGVVTITGASTGLTFAGASHTLSLGGLLNSTYGGLGVSNPTVHGILVGEGASAVTPIVLGAGQILIGTTASDPVAAAIGSGTGILVGNSSGAITVSLAAIASLNILSNITGGSAAPIANTLTATIDAAIGAAQGDILYRNASEWVVLAPGTSGQFLQTQGAAANPQWVTSATVTPAALTKVDDTNVTLTLGGTPSTALLQATSITLGWTGQLSAPRGGTGIGTYVIGDMLYASATNALSALAGNITTTKQYLSQTGSGAASAAPAWATIAGSDITGAALTKTDDTNVTLTLGGAPTTALLRAASLTLGWTGQLAVSRGGTGNSTFTAYSVLCAGTTATGAFQNVSGVGTSGQVLQSNGAGALPTWATIPGATSAALTKTDDTNVTLTLGGAPTTALLTATSLTLGWTGTLSIPRGGTGASSAASALTNLGAAASGANADITSLTGLSGTLRAPTGITSSAGLNLLSFQYNASAVNYIGVANSATGIAPVIGAAGSDTNVALQLQGHGTGQVYIKGTGTNDDTQAGFVGEYISSSVLLGSAVSFATGTSKNVTSIPLTAGDWDVCGLVLSNPNAATVTTQVQIGINTTTNTLPTVAAENNSNFVQPISTAGVVVALNVGRMRISLSATTTVYLVANFIFSVNVLSAYGFIGARRVR